MRIRDIPVADVRGALTAQRGRLLSMLTSLSDRQWAAPTEAPEWSVKDVALHLLAVDLSWLARERDHDQAGIIATTSDRGEFVHRLARHNQRWVDGTQLLSPLLITDLLRWSGQQLDAFLGTVDLTGPSSVYWAGEVPLWFDLAREFTERWVHYRQIQEAAWPHGREQPRADQEQEQPHGRDQERDPHGADQERKPDGADQERKPDGADQERDEYLPLVLRTFIWGFPHQYRAPAPVGTEIALDVPGIGAWTLARTATGWSLDEGVPAAPIAGLQMTGEAAWRLLTGARYDTRQVQLSGDPALSEPLLQVRGIIV